MLKLKAARALWRRRETSRLKRYHAARAHGDQAGAQKYKHLYDLAHHARVELDAKIRTYRITRVSADGVNLIKSFEGFVGHPYQDSVGVWTIGYGHTEGVCSSSPHVTEHQAASLLARDLDLKYAPYVAALRLPLNQHQFDALVSFVYNVGPGGIAASTRVGFYLRRRQWRHAADHLMDWDRAGGQVLEGLRRRRAAERTLFQGHS